MRQQNVQMKGVLRSLNSICLFTLVALLTSCHTTKHAGSSSSKPVKPAIKSAPNPVSGRYSRQPKFIDNIYMDHHAKSSATANAIQPRQYVEKPKPVSKPLPIAAEPVIASADPKAGYVYKESHPAVKEVPSKEEMPSRSESRAVVRKYAEMLGMQPKEIDNTALYAFIDKWYGTDYKMGGCDVNGIDCSGFARKLYSEIYGIDLERTSVDQFKNCQRIKRSKDAVEGDLVFFRIRGKRISHVGVYLANDYFVHASTSNGVMISNLNEEYWRKTYAGIGRLQ